MATALLRMGLRTAAKSANFERKIAPTIHNSLFKAEKIQTAPKYEVSYQIYNLFMSFMSFIYGITY